MNSISEIAKILAASPDSILPDPSAKIDSLLLDSRQIHRPETSLFFAIRGERHDGHQFLGDLFEKGVCHFVVEKMPQKVAADFAGATFLKVKNSLDALQKLAAFHRKQFEIPVVGLTGSNGKTVVKEWLFQLLNTDFQIVRSPKSWNSQVGVPLSVWQMAAENTLAIFEAGISRPGEMARLAEIIQPTVGIFTHLGAAHDEGFSSREAKFLEKMKLFETAETVILGIDDEAVRAGLKKIQAENELTHFITWSKNGQKGADFQVKKIKQTADGRTRFHVKSDLFELDDWQFEIPFSDEASLENALNCWCFLFDLGFREDEIDERLRRLETVGQRLEIRPGINRSTLLDDSWSNDLDSLRIALSFAKRQKTTGRKTLIISDLLQSGLPAGRLYAEVGRLISEKNFQRIFGIGAEIQAVKTHLPVDFEARFWPSTDAFLSEIGGLDFTDDLILLKGARPFRFEKIGQRLEQKAHKTRLEINLAALAHNLQAYARRLRPGVKICAMVKASGYGSGAVEVARLLEFHKVDYLAVAYADEGIELREAGIRLPILVLNPEESSFDAMARFGLEPEIYSLELLEAFSNAEFHIKLDTGMHRLGFSENDLPELIRFLKKNRSIEVRSIFSHLAASDAAGHDEFTREQVRRFQLMADSICKALKINPLRHILNTGGISRWPDFQFDMVRLGIGLYGIGAAGERLRVVNTLKATISQIKEIAPGESIGYNRLGRADGPTRIATISIGYADGLGRAAGNGRFSVVIHGQKAATVGSICMDMTMVDVSKIPQARAGDEVIIFGENNPVEDLAAALGTIPYEVFTGISSRVKRVYFEE